MVVKHLQSVGYRIFFPLISAGLLIAANPPPPHTHTHKHTSDQEAADKQVCSLLPSRASVLHARSLLASNQDSPIYIHVFVRSSERGGGGARAS